MLRHSALCGGGVRRCALLAAALVLACQAVSGSEPTYSECRPHIDATIRKLASRAMEAGSEPPSEVEAAVPPGQPVGGSGDCRGDKKLQEPVKKQSQSLEDHEKDIKGSEDHVIGKKDGTDIKDDLNYSKNTETVIKTPKNIPKHPEVKSAKFAGDKSAKDDSVGQDAPSQESSVHGSLSDVEEAHTKPSDVERKAGEKDDDSSEISHDSYKDGEESSVDRLRSSERSKDASKPSRDISPTGRREEQIAESKDQILTKTKPEPSANLEVKSSTQENRLQLDTAVRLSEEDTHSSSRPREAEKPLSQAKHEQNSNYKKKIAQVVSRVSSASTKKTTSFFNKFIELIFGKIQDSTRSVKWAEPWRTHEEHIITAVKEKNSTPKDTTGFIGKTFNRIIGTIFNCAPNKERDAKWSKPWQTHKRAKTCRDERPHSEVADMSTGVIGSAVNSFVSLLFGKPTNKNRDRKWALPWQSHSEQRREKHISSHKPIVKVAGPSRGLIDFVVSGLFGSPKGPRNTKYSKPWQTHIDRKPELNSGYDSKVVKVKGPAGGLMDFFISGLFGSPKGPRDIKYSRPWQTHLDRKPGSISVSGSKVVTVKGPSGGLFDFIISRLFGSPKGPRDPKYSRPWQTHLDRKPGSSSVSGSKVVTVKGPSGGLFDFLISRLFGSPKGPRDPKYSRPWQTQPGTKLGVSSVSTSEVEPVKEYGGIFDTIIRFIFAVKRGERDPKYAEPWKSHSPLEAETKKPKVVVGETNIIGHTFNGMIGLVFGGVPMDTVRERKWAEPWRDHVKTNVADNSYAIQSTQTNVVTKTLDNMIRKVFNLGLPGVRDDNWSQPWQEHQKEVNSPINGKEQRNRPKSGDQKHIKVTQLEAREKSPVAAMRGGGGATDKQEPSVTSSTHGDGNGGGDGDGGGADGRGADGRGAVGRGADGRAGDDEQDDGDEADYQSDYEVDDYTESNENEDEVVQSPGAKRSRVHVDSILGLNKSSVAQTKILKPFIQSTLKELFILYENNVKPLEITYKFHDISNRHISEAEIFSKPMVLLLGPYSTGKTTFLNYLMNLENTPRAMRSGATPSHGVFRIIQHGRETQELDGTALSADPLFSSLQQFGERFIDQLRGHSLNVPLLKKVTFVEAPGILETPRGGDPPYPFNDVLQWFMDRADLVVVMFDHSKLDAGWELEAVLNQLKGREAQVRILLNKADQIRPEELIKAQGALFWSLSPLLGASAPPTVYAGSFSDRPYLPTAPARLFQAQEEALLRDLARVVHSHVANRVATIRRHAVRVRNHAQMVSTYLATYHKNSGFFSSKHKLAEEIVDNPHDYFIYDDITLSTNISRYDLPDPVLYRDFFRLHNLYDFPPLAASCRPPCPSGRLDTALGTALPALLARYRREAGAGAG